MIGTGSSRPLWLILLLVALVPLLWGGNRPLIWYGTALSGGFMGLLLALGAVRSGAPLRLGVSRMPGLLALLLLTPALHAALALTAQVWPAPFRPHGSDEPLISLVRLTGPVLIGLITFHLLTVRNGRRRFGLLLLGVVLLHALYGLLILRSPDLALWPNPFYPGSLTGGFVNRNAAAAFLGVGACLALAAALTVPDRSGSRVDRAQRRLLYGVAALVLLTALLLTRSRMGVAATGAGLLLIALLHLIGTPRGRRGQGRGAAWSVLLAVPAGGVLFVLLAIDRVEPLIRNAGERIALYEEVWGLIRTAPGLGSGPGNFELAFRAHSGRLTDPGLRWEEAHNGLLERWAELGLLMGSVPAIALLALWARLLRLSLGAGDRFLPLAASGATLLFLLHGLVDFPLEMQGNLLLFCVLVAAALSGARRSGGA